MLKEYKIIFCDQWLKKEGGMDEGSLNIKLLSVCEGFRPLFHVALLDKPKNKRRQYMESHFSYCMWGIYDI